jgi:hypothetical protein
VFPTEEIIMEIVFFLVKNITIPPNIPIIGAGVDITTIIFNIYKIVIILNFAKISTIGTFDISSILIFSIMPSKL